MNKNAILEDLHKVEIFVIAYIKNDGSVRIAQGTLNEGFISQLWEPTGRGYEEGEDIIRYFDLDAQNWRSFRVDRFVGLVGEYIDE